MFPTDLQEIDPEPSTEKIIDFGYREEYLMSVSKQNITMAMLRIANSN